MPFDRLWTGSRRVTISAVPIRVASIEHLIELEHIAGRPQDLADVERLREVLRSKEAPDGSARRRRTPADDGQLCRCGEPASLVVPAAHARTASGMADRRIAGGLRERAVKPRQPA
jgi:hypothetical protein